MKTPVNFLQKRAEAARKNRSLTSLPFVKCLLVSFAALLLTHVVTAQIRQAWVARYHNGLANGNHQALKMLLDPVGNIYVCGFSANTNGGTGYATLKYAPSGTLLWAARYDSTNFPSAQPSGLALDGRTNAIVTGNAVTVKYDPNGNPLWMAPYSATAVAVDNSNNICITGVFSNFETIKLDSSGSIQWDVTNPASFSGPQNLSQAVASDSAGNFYVAGSELIFSSPSILDVIATVIRYDPHGAVSWKIDHIGDAEAPSVVISALTMDSLTNTYVELNLEPEVESYVTSKISNEGMVEWTLYNPSRSAASVGHSVVADTSQNVYITGQYVSNPPVSIAYGTLKIDPSGSYAWTNLFPQNTNGGSGGNAMTLDKANNIYVTGSLAIANTTNDIVTVAFDSNGRNLWWQRYDGAAHGNDQGNAIVADHHGNVYVAGYETVAGGGTGMILIKYSPITMQHYSNGNFLLQAQGAPKEPFDIQVTTNLQTWLDLGTDYADTNGLLQFLDTNAFLHPFRFYLAIPQ